MEVSIETSLAAVKAKLHELRPLLVASHGRISHTKKTDNSSLTELDLHVEKELKQTIAAVDPTVGFYGEEFGQEGNEERFWTIDPIDGTEAFIRGLPFCCNMLAYIESGEVVASVIYNFPLDDYYVAIRGKGSFCNDQPIHVSDRDISHACVEFEIRVADSTDQSIYFGIPRFSMVKFSAAGYGFCQVARGRTEARLSYHAYGKIWDYAPGTLLVEEAGGMVANIGQTKYSYHNSNIIASNATIHNDLHNFFNSIEISS